MGSLTLYSVSGVYICLNGVGSCPTTQQKCIWAQVHVQRDPCPYSRPFTLEGCRLYSKVEGAYGFISNAWLLLRGQLDERSLRKKGDVSYLHFRRGSTRRGELNTLGPETALARLGSDFRIPI